MNRVTVPMGTLRLLLADDHEMVRVAMRHALSALASDIEWLEAADAASAEAALARRDDIDLALLDLHMPGAGAATWVATLRARHPAVPLVVVSGDESPALVRALIAHGVAGFIPKSDRAAVMLQAVRLVLSGGTYVPLRLVTSPAPVDRPSMPAPAGLTARQGEVLRLLARGWPNKLIARELGVSEGTVKVHLLAIFRALDASNRTQAVVVAQKKLRADGLVAEMPGVPGS